jgi:cyclopropane fatty-acyl-phospholipid synthase-like methyltransferase
MHGCKHPEKHAGHHFDNAQDWAAKFEDPSRDAWQKPNEVIAALGLNEHSIVADIGSATGYFSVRLAKVLPSGKVFGIDVESSMVEYLNARAEKEELTNLKSILGAYEDPKIPLPVDLILVVNTFHHIEARVEYFKRLLVTIKPNGKLVVIDFTKNSKMGPPEQLKMDKAQVTQELTQSGYVLETEHTFLPEQHFLVFAKK